MNNPVVTKANVQSRVLPIVADQVTVFGAENQRLLNDIVLTIAGRGITVVMGPNGAGKSLLLRVLTGLVSPSTGTMSWAGQTVLGPNVKHMGFVFQKPILFRRTVRDNITFALRTANLPKEQALQTAESTLKDADLFHLADAPARRLSGGEQQRVAIARARAINPEILFLDEPTAHLDPTSTAIIETMINDTAARGTRIVHVTHDLGQAKRLANDVIFIHRGNVEEHAEADTFFAGQKSKAAQAFVAGDLVI